MARRNRLDVFPTDKQYDHVLKAAAPMIGVFYAGQDFKTDKPMFEVERAVARQWLDDGRAWSVNHGRDIALTPATIEEYAGAKDERELIRLLATARAFHKLYRTALKRPVVV